MTGRRLPAAAATGRALAVAGMALVVAGCAIAAPPSPAAATPVPSVAPAATSGPPPAAPPPAGSELVDVHGAGIRLPVPSAWERMTGEELADAASRADIVGRYPGMAPLLDAAERMGDRAVPALLALDPAGPGDEGVAPPSVSVLVAQPPVSGPLLDLVAGFVSAGLVEAFGGAQPVRTRLVTPVGEGIRLAFTMPAAGDTELVATAYVIAGVEGTLLVTVIGPDDAPPASDPDAVVRAATPLS